jgi:hypothetical protein
MRAWVCSTYTLGVLRHGDEKRQIRLEMIGLKHLPSRVTNHHRTSSLSLSRDGDIDNQPLSLSIVSLATAMAWCRDVFRKHQNLENVENGRKTETETWAYVGTLRFDMMWHTRSRLVLDNKTNLYLDS